MPRLRTVQLRAVAQLVEHHVPSRRHSAPYVARVRGRAVLVLEDRDVMLDAREFPQQVEPVIQQGRSHVMLRLLTARVQPTKS